ncbi:unnamed protein product [Ambrosiozyma monospora]|uniref:Unnamed protein product n=1 Tax=Ambrosiozyma monospora TaxID=43982 RepID=A0A9W7DFC5_AMBMO|nr:unnamed protein product [Ambrosiozyma monospora]
MFSNRITTSPFRTFRTFRNSSSFPTRRSFSIFPSFKNSTKSSFFKQQFNRFNSSKANTNTNGKKKTGIKALMQEYGYSALGVYLGLSCIDLPLCFLLVHSQGADQISEFQDQVLSWIGWGKDNNSDDQNSTDLEPSSASQEKEKKSTLLTEFAVAYAIHKSLIFIRIPITAAITPAIVKKLRSLGFNVGKLHHATRSTIEDVGLKKAMSVTGAKSVARGIKTNKPANSINTVKDASASNNPRFGKTAGKGSRWFF